MSFSNSLIFPESFSIDLPDLVVGQGKRSSREGTGKRVSGGWGGDGSQPSTRLGVGLTADSSVTLGCLLNLSGSQFLLVRQTCGRQSCRYCGGSEVPFQAIPSV